MRSVGLGLAFAATVQFVLVSTPAFAQPPSDTAAAPSSAPAAPASDSTTTAPAATTPAAATPAAPVPAATAGNVTVHIQSSKPVTLERLSGSTWEGACTSPCDKSLSSSDTYRITGAGLNESKTFMLDTSVGDKVTLDVKPGSQAKVTTGTWVLVGGGVLLVGGVVALLAGSSNNAVQGGGGTVTSTKNTDWIFVGTSLILGGVILGITGGSLMLNNSHTKVDGPVDSTTDGKKNNEGVKAQVTASRLPTWHDDRGPSLAPVNNILPLVNTTF